MLKLDRESDPSDKRHLGDLRSRDRFLKAPGSERYDQISYGKGNSISTGTPQVQVKSSLPVSGRQVHDFEGKPEEGSTLPSGNVGYAFNPK